MPPQPIVDSHVHLYPLSDANAENHAWMASVPALLKNFEINEYVKASTRPNADYEVKGLVFIEVDRNLNPSAERVEDLAWGPLKEIRYLRGVVEGENGYLIKGIVPWAPLDREVKGLKEYLAVAEKEAGPEMWKRVKGFRFLLQGMTDKEKFKALTDSEEFIEALKELGGKWVFDIGVDSRDGLVWQLEEAIDIIERAHRGVPKEKKVAFVFNHLCKPDMLQTPTTVEQKEDFARWKASVERYANFDKVYMKLSGGFSQMGKDQPESPMTVSAVVDRLRPWIDVVMSAFKPDRIMFGSDWPVCNLGGPGDELSWSHWKNAVSAILDEHKLSKAEKDRMWYGTAVEAYNLDTVIG